MEQPFSTSKVTVEYFDPHDVYKLLAPGLIPRLPLRNLNWQSHAGPLRSIDTLHVELLQGDDPGPATSPHTLRRSGSTVDDGFQQQNFGGQTASADQIDTQSLPSRTIGSQRRHQIPGLRRTPYLKVLLVRCDDNETYKTSVRAEIREWIKTHIPSSNNPKRNSKQEKHDAFDYLILHVVLPNTAASTQPRTSARSQDTSEKSGPRWRTGSTPLFEKLRTDFSGLGKTAPDRVAQIRIGINDLPYDQLPRVVPAVPTGYLEDEHDAENAWAELIAKLKSLILTSFDLRVTQYEEDIKEKDGQRSLPGWNFCTFFILKEGLARGFESVGLVEDALVGYDELSVGLDSVVNEQADEGSPTRHGGAMLSHTDDLKEIVRAALAKAPGGNTEDEEAVDLQSNETIKEQFDEIPISATKKAYRDKILANDVSVFDFRCYIFARQMALLLRLGNAWSSKDDLLAKLKEQQESVLHGVAPLAPPPKHTEESENLASLGEICRRTLQFIPAISQIMRRDILTAVASEKSDEDDSPIDPNLSEIMDNVVASFAFSVAQQILAQTASKSLPIPPSTLTPSQSQEQKTSIPEPKTMMHPARTSSLHVSTGPAHGSRPPLSPGVFPGPGMPKVSNDHDALFLKAGLEDLAAKRAELYMLSRSILDGLGKKRGWSDGWQEAPIIAEAEADFEEISLDQPATDASVSEEIPPLDIGVNNNLLQTAIDSPENFYRLYEILTDKALRHYTIANHDHAVQASMADLAVLNFFLKEFGTAASYFYRATPFYGESGWTSLELSMLVMYLHCLREMKSKDDYVRVALKLLTKSCAAEKERLEQRSKRVSRIGKPEPADAMSMKGVVGNLFDLASSLSSQVKVHLSNFFTNIEVAGAPEYYDKEDKCTLTINLWSLLPDDIKLDGVEVRVTTSEGGPTKELHLSRTGDVVLHPGQNSVKVECTSVVPGKYKIDHLGLSSSNLLLHFERDINQTPSPTTDIFRHPEVVIFQRTGALDVQLTATKHTALDKNNTLDLTLSSGWNSLKNCEIRVKPTTGGLRLLTLEAKVVNSSVDFAKKPESGGVLYFNQIAAETTVTFRFPYSVEQDMADVSAKVDVTYTTESGQKYAFAKSIVIPISLALGVNVQDVFKHQALYSRFNVSTASPSPLRLYKSELIPSDLFESEFGVPPADTTMVFSKQPATLLYRIKRKTDVRSSKRVARTMYLKLYYNILQTEIEEAIVQSIFDTLNDPSLESFSKLISTVVVRETKSLQPIDLERASLLGAVPTNFLADVPWDKYFAGIGRVPGTQEDATEKISAAIKEWQTSNSRIQLPTTQHDDPCTLLIPVEIPSLSILHTADIELQTPRSEMLDQKPGAVPTVAINQMLPATLHLKWTQIWDTEMHHKKDIEYSYEVTAPADTWLLGGRRKGHFVIPGSKREPLSSSSDSEAQIPLIMIPLREGWLPYPAVEIREVKDGVENQLQTCEVDFRNLGESIRAVCERKGVTVSLDASGPGGGPLVLDSEEPSRERGRIVA
ncbi:related to TRS130 TRAPP subunit of 130 kDa involved in targeting and fusion of ER to golgi transport vesicles [Fusarium torulosum]|uniref:Related to TRS130 TRAPP subunit of 130 kDa involved in targeting and fusion of ER to golgi transport vesicles n=1 Tax=Fusarium torulosum TaxID=33205 RepID=A0AAE8MI67_9HYPO|nr:related to TRS130 TRAPP subunit of 130 kDa involved in targeting and fusion of ER to golgi transport vesicles [Fusarium torulosum]